MTDTRNTAEVLLFHPLTFLDEADAVTVGRPDIDSYCVLPADGAFLLRRLTEGAPPGLAAEEYRTHYGESVDVEDFVASMAELGFLRTDHEPEATGRPLRGQHLGRALFSRPAWVVFAALIAAALLEVVRHPDLLPRPRDLFFTDYVTVVVLTLFLAQIPLLLLHEAFHMLAGRRAGLDSRLGLGRRLWFIVTEASMDGLATVPRRRRYLPILAGMLADLLALSTFLLLASAVRGPDGAQPLAGRVCLALAMATVLRLTWQFQFYLRTDLYYLAATATGCLDLHGSAMILLRNRAAARLRRPGLARDENLVHPRDLGPARWYGRLVVLGYGVCLTVAALAGLPTLVHALGQVAGALTADHATAGERGDAIVFVALLSVQTGLLTFVFTRDRRRRAQGR